nr:hypothetical protein [Tanacetum cinerariifolium]
MSNVYVDDILIMGNNITMLQDVKSWFCKCFSMKDLGEASYILRIKITRDRSKRLISLSQSAYFDKILKKFKMENSKRSSVSMQEKTNLSITQGAKTPIEQKPDEAHWIAVKTILKYLRNTKDMVLVYGGKPETELKKSAKQSTIAMSSIEAEYIAASKALMEAVWMRKFIDRLGNVMPTNKRHMEILCDNMLAIAIAIDPVIMKGARHY